MAILRISAETEGRLIKADESGMGFQLIRYRGDTLMVLNATIALPLSELRERKVSEDDYPLFSGNPDSEQISRLEKLEIYDEFSIAYSNLDRKFQDRSIGLAFSETAASPPESVIPSGLPHSYYRLSAYYRDKRVDSSTGDFLPGTYATTYTDLHFAPSGFAAVGRYALPNPASARFVFQVVTLDRPTLMGTATPNFGQAGGGVEVLFQNRAKNCPGRSFMINAG